MILEKASLIVKLGQEEQFEKDFKVASQYISAVKGYISHSLHLCLEKKNKYLLLVQWETLQDHTTGFRESDQYLQWKSLLHHYYHPFPIVEHYVEKYKNKQ